MARMASRTRASLMPRAASFSIMRSRETDPAAGVARAPVMTISPGNRTRRRSGSREHRGPGSDLVLERPMVGEVDGERRDRDVALVDRGVVAVRIVAPS